MVRRAVSFIAYMLVFNPVRKVTATNCRISKKRGAENGYVAEEMRPLSGLFLSWLSSGIDHNRSVKLIATSETRYWRVETKLNRYGSNNIR